MNPNAVVSQTGPSRDAELVEKELAYAIVGCAIDVHNELGTGFSESVYARSLAVALQQKGFRVEREYPVTVVFRGVEVGTHRLDLVVEGRVVVEIKAMERIPQGAMKQVRHYLAASRFELGILINFGARVEFHRILSPWRD